MELFPPFYHTFMVCTLPYFHGNMAHVACVTFSEHPSCFFKLCIMATSAYIRTPRRREHLLAQDILYNSGTPS